MIHVLLILFCLLFIFTVVASTSHFQKALLGLSVFALMAQIIFQIVLGALPPYGHFFPNCKFRLVLVNKFFDCIASVTQCHNRAWLQVDAKSCLDIDAVGEIHSPVELEFYFVWYQGNSETKLQSWTKVLGTVLQYSYFSVISRFPLKTVHPFQNFLAALPAPTLLKVEARKKILDARFQHCLLGEGRGWTCVN